MLFFINLIKLKEALIEKKYIKVTYNMKCIEYQLNLSKLILETSNFKTCYKIYIKNMYLYKNLIDPKPTILFEIE